MRQDVVQVGIREDAFGNDFLEEFATAFKKTNGAVGLRELVVGFIGFQDDNDKRLFPGMVSEGNSSIEDLEESTRVSLEGPLEKAIVDAAHSWG